MRTIIFFGHFELFENLTDLQIKSANLAKYQIGDSAILVGDIGILDKIEAYLQQGKAGIIYLYSRRIDCAKSICIMSQLPEKENLEQIIDFNQYDVAKNILLKYQDVYTYLINGNYKNNRLIYEKYVSIVNQEIIPTLIDLNLLKYNLNKKEIKIYFEKNLRNLVSKNMSKNKKGTWGKILSNLKDQIIYNLFSGVEASPGNPSCRGILLSLYELLANENYRKIIQIYPIKHKIAILKAEQLWVIMKDKLVIQSKQDLTFEDIFLEG